MVFGLGAGKMTISLDKSNYSFGETIKGTAFLDLKQSINARGVKLKFWGEEITKYYGSNSNVSVGSARLGSRTKNFGNRNETRKVNEVLIDLEQGEKDYSSKEYEFELKIPQYFLPEAKGASLNLGPLSLKAGNSRNTTIKWFLEISLDIPKGFDVSKKIQLNIA
jgi:hypothetical protein